MTVRLALAALASALVAAATLWWVVSHREREYVGGWDEGDDGVTFA